MARQLRIEYPGAVYHVTSRGNGRQRIFITDKDRLKFFKFLERTTRHYKILLHAYCLMGNHYHLLLETPEPNLSRAMKYLDGLYTQNFNWRHGRSGHVFQGRFKAILVEKGEHLLELCRYIVLNPVRAGLVEGPELYRWSSYRATGGMEKAPKWLTVRWVRSQFHGDRQTAVGRYREFVREGLGKKEVPWKQVVGQLYYGSAKFVRGMKAGVGMNDESEYPREQRLPDKPELEELLAQKGAAEEVLRGQSLGYTLKEMADHLGLHYSTLTHRVRKSMGCGTSRI